MPKKKPSRISGASIPSCDPEELVLVTDEKHELYDDRVHDPLNEALIVNMMAHGILKPVDVVRDGPNLLVADGRQRVKNGREANRRLKKLGSKPLRIHYIVKRATGASAIGIMAASFIRTADAPTSRAKKMLKQREFGYTDAQIAVDFGCDEVTVRNAIALLDCAPEVQKAVDKGLAQSVAKKLGKLPRVEQIAALATMKAEGATKGARAELAVARVTAEASGGSGGARDKAREREEAASARPKVLGAKVIAGIAKRLRSHPFDEGYTPSVCAAMVLDYVTGKSPDLANFFPWHATGKGKEPKLSHGLAGEIPGGGSVSAATLREATG